MTLHSILQYLSYRRKAKGRHGTHSPFVYAFVEDCIEKNRQESLASRINPYFKDWEINHLSHDPGSWQQELSIAMHGTQPKLLFIVPGIHKTPKETKAWSALCLLSSIDYSMDLFTFGLLFINDDFKEKQHFILKK